MDTPDDLRRHAATLRLHLLSLPRDADPHLSPALLSAAAWLEAAARALPPTDECRHGRA